MRLREVLLGATLAGLPACAEQAAGPATPAFSRPPPGAPEAAENARLYGDEKDYAGDVRHALRDVFGSAPPAPPVPLTATLTGACADVKKAGSVPSLTLEQANGTVCSLFLDRNAHRLSAHCFQAAAPPARNENHSRSISRQGYSSINLGITPVCTLAVRGL